MERVIFLIPLPAQGTLLLLPSCPMSAVSNPYSSTVESHVAQSQGLCCKRQAPLRNGSARSKRMLAYSKEGDVWAESRGLHCNSRAPLRTASVCRVP